MIPGHAAPLMALAALGAHRLVLTAAYLARRDRLPPAADPDLEPFVTVQLPLYNERFVAARVIRAACALDWPRDRLEIQVLDDSTDDTRALAAAAVAAGQAAGVPVVHRTRADRLGFKAGALAAGMAAARGEVFLVLDADFVPEPDLLRRTAGHFADPRVGFVQLRWAHANRAVSALTRAAALLLDGHFLIEHHARFTGGHLFNFNGTAGLLRRQAIEEAGGWAADTLTEDLDLSYRMQIAGWRGVYLKDRTCAGDLPAAMPDLKSQQRRWVEGALQTARKLARPLLASPLPRLTRLEAAAHLATNLGYPLMLAAFLMPAAHLTPVETAAGATGLAGAMAFYTVAHADGAPAAGPLARAAAVTAALALGAGLAVSNALAVARGCVGRGGAFERTPKLAGTASRPAGYVARTGATPLVELALGLYLLTATLTAIAAGAPLAAALRALAAAGTLWVAFASLV